MPELSTLNRLINAVAGSAGRPLDEKTLGLLADYWSKPPRGEITPRDILAAENPGKFDGLLRLVDGASKAFRRRLGDAETVGEEAFQWLLGHVEDVSLKIAGERTIFC